MILILAQINKIISLFCRIKYFFHLDADRYYHCESELRVKDDYGIIKLYIHLTSEFTVQNSVCQILDPEFTN